MAHGGGSQIRESYVTTSSMASWRDSRDLGDQEETEKRREDSASWRLFGENDEEGPNTDGAFSTKRGKTRMNEIAARMKHLQSFAVFKATVMFLT